MLGHKPEKELEILYSHLPTKPYVGDFKAQTLITSKDKIKNYSYLQYNHPEIARYIVIDCDEQAFNFVYTDLKPNLLVMNKENGKGHAFFRMKGFVGSTAKSKWKPQKTLRLINHAIINMANDNGIGADPCFNGLKAKNPFNSNYRVSSYNQEPWDFNEFFEYIPDKYIYSRKPEIVQGSEVIEVAGRNCYLFETTRKQAYVLKAKITSFDRFYNAVHDVALKINGNMSIPLDYSEVKSVIKSVATWTWKHYHGDTKNRGVMDLTAKGHNLTLKDRQVLGAKYSHKIRTDNTEQRIVEAVEALQADNVKITQRAIAERSGLNKNTLTKYKDLVKKLK
jgi:hypothetical protein